MSDNDMDTEIDEQFVDLSVSQSIPLSNDIQKNLERYDLPLRQRFIQKYPEYMSNTYKYGVDLIPRNINLRKRKNYMPFLPDIELQVATYWKHKSEHPKAIFMRLRKQKFFKASILILTFYRGMKDYFSIPGDLVQTLITKENIPLSNVGKEGSDVEKDEGYWIPIEYFSFGQLK